MRRALLCLLLAANLRAAVYYVDPGSGSDSNAGTSTGAAWAHVPGSVGFTGSGWATINNGDTVVVKGGTTNNCQVLIDNGHFSGSAAFDSITIISGHLYSTPWGSGRAIFDQQNTRLYGIAFSTGAVGITFDGFEVREVKDGSNAIFGSGSACIEMGAISSKPTNIKVRRCYLHHAYGTTTDHGFGVEWYGPDVNSASTCIVELNRIKNVRTKGIECYGTNNIIRKNFVTKTGDHGIVFSGTYLDLEANLIDMVFPDNGIAEVNGAFVHDPVYAFKANHGNCDIFNNLAYSSTAADHAQGFASHGPTVRFFHNSAANFKQTGNFGDNGANAFNIGFERDSANDQSNNSVQNSVGAFCAPSTGNGQFFFYYLSTNMVAKYNDWCSTAGSQIATWYDGSTHQLTLSQLDGGGYPNGISISNDQNVDPAWTGGSFPSDINDDGTPNTDYFKLTSSTPSAVLTTSNSLSGSSANGAQASSKFSTDILGNTRSSWSMGAYEYVVATPATVPQGKLGRARPGGRHGL